MSMIIYISMIYYVNVIVLISMFTTTHQDNTLRIIRG